MAQVEVLRGWDGDIRASNQLIDITSKTALLQRIRRALSLRPGERIRDKAEGFDLVAWLQETPRLFAAGMASRIATVSGITGVRVISATQVDSIYQVVLQCTTDTGAIPTAASIEITQDRLNALSPCNIVLSMRGVGTGARGF